MVCTKVWTGFPPPWSRETVEFIREATVYGIHLVRVLKSIDDDSAWDDLGKISSAGLFEINLHFYTTRLFTVSLIDDAK